MGASVPALTRRWGHPSQRIVNVPGGVELTMTVRGATEALSWVLGFGNEAEVGEPLERCDAVRDEFAAALKAYV